MFVLERDQLTGASVGLSLAEAHALLASIQEAVVCAQVTVAVAEQRCCSRCGRAHRHKDTRTITVRTLFGTLHPDSPRFLACPCRTDGLEAPATFSPLTAILAGRSTPELVYLQACTAEDRQGSRAAEKGDSSSDPAAEGAAHDQRRVVSQFVGA